MFDAHSPNFLQDLNLKLLLPNNQKFGRIIKFRVYD